MMPPPPEVFAWTIAEDPRFISVGVLGGIDDGVLWNARTGEVQSPEVEPTPFDGAQLVQPHSAQRMVTVDTRGRL